MAFDQGTTSSRAILFDRDGSIAAVDQYEFSQHFPKPGWVEHDPLEIWETQLRAARGALDKAGAEASAIAAIGITNQRETTVVWDRATGEPIHSAIVWQSRQTAPICEELRSRGLADEVRARTGLVIDAYFSATKVRFILDAVDRIRDDRQLVALQAHRRPGSRDGSLQRLSDDDLQHPRVAMGRSAVG